MKRSISPELSKKRQAGDRSDTMSVTENMVACTYEASEENMDYSSTSKVKEEFNQNEADQNQRNNKAAHVLLGCLCCNDTFKTKPDLDKHILTVHADLKARFVCPNCPNFFTTKKLLKEHKISFHDIVRPFKCTECECSFQTNERLSEHIIVDHKKICSYECSKCLAVFPEGIKLFEHIQTTHAKPNPLQCHQCKYTCKRKIQLSTHMRTCQGRKKSYQCVR